MAMKDNDGGTDSDGGAVGSSGDVTVVGGAPGGGAVDVAALGFDRCARVLPPLLEVPLGMPEFFDPATYVS
ncbi:hypothetical protein U1Q18_014882 [Sarracenia purpurea var. burkii]